jgi:hypothetical protein
MRKCFQAGRLLGRIRNALFPGDLEFRAQIFAVLAVAGVFIGLFPIMFFSVGGYHSGMPGFFVFVIVFTIFMERTELKPGAPALRSSTDG